MRKLSIHHYLWFIALFLCFVLAIVHSAYWYVPIAVYLIAETLGIFILSIFKGKVKELPKIAKEAAIRTIKK